MKSNVWIKCKDEMPEEYDWVIVRDGEKKTDCGGTLAFARWTKEKGWDFWDTESNFTHGPYAGDSTATLFKDDINEWIYIDTWGDEKKLIKDSENLEREL